MTDDTSHAADEPVVTDAPSSGPVRITLPTWMSAASLVVGIAFSGFAIIWRGSFPSDADYRLTLCIGFGLVLSALGTQASGKWRSWSVAGGGAAATMLYLLLYYTAAAPPPAEDSAMIARIEGGFDPATTVVQVEAHNNERLFTAWGRVGQTLRVRIETDHVASGCLGFVSFVSSADGLDGDEFVTYVPTQFFQALTENQPPPGTQELVALHYSSEANTLFSDAGGSEPISFPSCPIFTSARDIGSTAAVAPVLFELLVPTARAAEKEIPVDALVKGLTRSSNALVRREARQLLGAKGVDAIGPTMAALAADPDVYRVQLGAAAALSEVLSGKVDPAEVRARLNDADIARIAPLVAHPDRALRRTATAAMISLADPRAIDHWTRILTDSPSLKGRYNAAYILNRTFTGYDAAAQDRIRSGAGPLYDAQGVQTKALLDPVVAPAVDAVAGGWVSVGVNYGKGWAEKLFTWDGEDAGPPEANDILTASAPIELHSDHLRYVVKQGWVDAPTVGELAKGQQVRVTEVKVVAQGLHWVKVEPAE